MDIITMVMKSDILKGIVFGLLGVIASWYDIKSDIRELKKNQESQTIRDAGQDQSLKDLKQDLKEQIQDSNRELKQEFRDLRRDLGRTGNGRNL